MVEDLALTLLAELLGSTMATRPAFVPPVRTGWQHFAAVLRSGLEPVAPTLRDFRNTWALTVTDKVRHGGGGGDMLDGARRFDVWRDHAIEVDDFR